MSVGDTVQNAEITRPSEAQMLQERLVKLTSQLSTSRSRIEESLALMAQLRNTMKDLQNRMTVTRVACNHSKHVSLRMKSLSTG